jgi:hypothetical protein
MTKLTWKKCGIKYYDMVDDFVKSYFDDVNDYPEAMSVYQEIEKMTPSEILEKVGNPDYNAGEFRKNVMNTAYKALWHYYQI